MALVLVGMRGAGKSTAGRLAARALGVPFLDSDVLLEERHGRTIAELFAAGEEAFRAAESTLLLELFDSLAAGDRARSRPELLLATGGGCLQSAAVVEALRRQNTVVWLRAALPLLARRIAGSARPSLTGAPRELELAPLLCQREPLYRAVATHEIHTDTLTANEVADAIQQLWSLPAHHHLR